MMAAFFPLGRSYYHVIPIAQSLGGKIKPRGAILIKGEVQSRITIILKERVKISLQIGAKIMKIG